LVHHGRRQAVPRGDLAEVRGNQDGNGAQRQQQKGELDSELHIDAPSSFLQPIHDYKLATKPKASRGDLSDACHFIAEGGIQHQIQRWAASCGLCFSRFSSVSHL
jgi:hypothetical protein